MSLHVGKKLPTGAIILAIRDKGSTPAKIVLALNYRPHEQQSPYVTWVAVPPIKKDDPYEMIWAHYFDNIWEAARDFMDRS